ncbi:MAG TPA: IgGFc-binding protein [Nannocystis sp.]|jgi:hypothetical protein
MRTRHATLAFVLGVAACGDSGTTSATTEGTTGDTTAATDPSSPISTPTSTPMTGEPTGTTVVTDGSVSETIGTTVTTTTDTTAGPTTESDASSDTTMGVVTQTTGDTTNTGTTGDTTGGGCPQGQVVCEGDIAKTCDGMGGFTDETPCALGCVEGEGCVMCEPGAKSCEGEISKICNETGTAEDEFLCDGVQGVTCDPNAGECVGACSPNALGKSYIGCDYYPTITANIVTDNFSFAVVVANTSNQTANLEIDKAGKLVLNDSVGPQSVKVIKLPWDYALKGDDVMPVSMLVPGGAYRLRSDQPVTVYQYNPIEYEIDFFDNSVTNDASLLLPVNVWTGDYFVAARNTWDAVGFGQIVPGFYTVTASEDDTTVTLLPSETGNKVLAGGGVKADGTGQVKLDRGDALQIFSALINGNPSAADVTGTRITADKKIQVIGGHICTFIPYDIGYCDHLEESMFPYETLAKKYIITPALIPTGGDVPKAQMVRIIATEDNTTLTYDPPQNGGPAMIAKAGQYVEIADTVADFEVTSNNKILISQYMQGQDAGGDSGDPAMALAVATEQYRKSYLFHAPINYEVNYVNITAPLDAKVTLDNVAVAGLKPIGATGLGVARVKLGNNVDGNHDVKADKPIGISVYGYGQYTSYWYPGGLDLEPLPQ